MITYFTISPAGTVYGPFALGESPAVVTIPSMFVARATADAQVPALTPAKQARSQHELFLESLSSFPLVA